MATMLARVLDWQKYLKRMLPVLLRTKTTHKDVLMLLTTGIRALNQSLVDLRSYLLLEYQGTGQRIVLERILRDRLAGGTPKIWVINGTEAREEYDLYLRTRPGAAVYGYTRAEIDEGALTGYLYLRPEMYEDGDPDFTVNVQPALWATLTNQQKQLLISLIERFKVYGTTYAITHV